MLKQLIAQDSEHFFRNSLCSGEEHWYGRIQTGSFGNVFMFLYILYL